MKTIYLVRHGKAEGQPFSAPLTDKGREQARALVDFFKDRQVDKIYSSPYKRAVETITPVAENKKLNIIEDDRLSERVLSNTSFSDWQEKLKASFADFELVFEGGETQASGMKRAVSILEDVLAAKHQHIILVSHGNLTTLLLRYFNQQFGYHELMEMTNPDVFEVVISKNQPILRRIWDERV
ncbi:histidine phosphatase family protein [Bacillus aquiflavi]|uniref:Histidine phosphatase family protein n=1 Tax=Bacillus aquiflavi TaxID=2672567 RepID=A0A6B3W502_9BACI|nr:histidine phosphatase family protein [Bacillus aquiflavi]MBA4538205.1 histidine phosphatase family protein [Bacillus aquiflavi]NEY82524.1 histidine phosphatase family protein [Bacillus aquiflavi]UAC47165.1 histidine phosphatase family protein [Bacillus aquiflavi]